MLAHSLLVAMALAGNLIGNPGAEAGTGPEASPPAPARRRAGVRFS